MLNTATKKKYLSIIALATLIAILQINIPLARSEQIHGWAKEGAHLIYAFNMWQSVPEEKIDSVIEQIIEGDSRFNQHQLSPST